MFNGTDDWYKIWMKTTELWFSKWHQEFEKFHRLKNSDFNSESKMAELIQNKN